MKIASFNIYGVLSPVKRGKILSKLKKARAEFVFVQETHLNDAEHSKRVLRRYTLHPINLYVKEEWTYLYIQTIKL